MWDWSSYYISMIEQLTHLNDRVDKVLYLVLFISLANLMYFIIGKKWVKK